MCSQTGTENKRLKCLKKTYKSKKSQTLSGAKDLALPPGSGQTPRRISLCVFSWQCEILRRSPRRPPQNDSPDGFFRSLLQAAARRFEAAARLRGRGSAYWLERVHAVSGRFVATWAKSSSQLDPEGAGPVEALTINSAGIKYSFPWGSSAVDNSWRASAAIRPSQSR